MKKNNVIALCLTLFGTIFIVANVFFIHIAFPIIALLFIELGLVLSSDNIKMGHLLFILPFACIFKFSFSEISLFYFPFLTYILYFLIKLIFNKKITFSTKNSVYILFFFYFFLIPGILKNNFLSVAKLCAFVAFVYVYTLTNHIFNRKIIIFCAIVGLLYSCLTSIFIYFTPSVFKQFILLANTSIRKIAGLYRFSAFMADANIFAFYILCLLEAILFNDDMKEPLKIISVVFLSICGILSMSTTYLLILIILLTVTLYFVVKKRVDAKCGVIFLCLNFACIICGAFLFVRKINMSFELDSIFSGRIQIWFDYIKYFFHSPKIIIFGNGFSSNRQINGLSFYGHSILLDCIYDFGLASTAFLMYKTVIFLRKQRGYVILTLITLLIFAMTSNIYSSIFAFTLTPFLVHTIVNNYEDTNRHQS